MDGHCDKQNKQNQKTPRSSFINMVSTYLLFYVLLQAKEQKKELS